MLPSFKELVDLDRLQLMMDQLYRVTGLALAVLDQDNEVLVACGWQRMCTDFHRVNPATCRKCHESDRFILDHLDAGAPVEYKCKNGLWDIASPVIIEGRHLATVFFGQFFYDDDIIDREFFRQQARQNGFDEDDYLKSLDEIPVVSREKVAALVSYQAMQATAIAESGLARLMVKKENLEQLLRKDRELSAAKNLLERIIENLPVGLQIFDRDGYSVSMNKKQQELLGVPDSTEGVGSFNVLTDPYSQAHGADKNYRRAYNGETVQHIQQFNFDIAENDWQTRPGSRWFEEVIFPVFDDKQNISNVIALLNDITDKVSGEKQLKESEERYRRLTEGIPGVIYIFSSTRGGIFYSDGVEKILGYNKQTLYGRPMLWHDSIHKDDRAKINQAFEDFHRGKPFELEYRIQNSKGQWLWFMDRSIGRIEKDDEVLVEGIAVDITALKETQNKLKELNATKDKIFSIIAHDIKGPIASMLALLDLMDESIRENDINELLKFRDVMKKGHEKVYNLLTNLLEWAMVQTGRLEVKPQKINLHETAVNTINFYQNALSDKNITVKNNVPPECLVWADNNMLTTVLRNLVSNARKFSYPGGEIEISALTEKDNIVFSVKDNGTGMSKESAEHIFEIGATRSSRGTAGEAGTGLGLVLCREFINTQGGRITVESHDGQGTTICVTLPAAAAVTAADY